MFWRNPSPIKSHTFAGYEVEVNLAYDNILTMFDVLDDDDLQAYQKFDILFDLFTQEAASEAFDWQFKIDFVLDMLRVHLDIDLESEQEGTPILPKFDFIEDADRILASFLQDYNIDLLEQHGKLPWWTFNALLFNLSENTPFQQAIHYRTCDIPRQDKHNKDEVKRIKDMKKFYALKGKRYERLRQEQQLKKAMNFLTFVQNNAKKGGN